MVKKSAHPKKNYIITSAQACASPHGNFVKGLETYAEENDSEVIVLPMIGLTAKEDLDQIHGALSKFNVEVGSRVLNNNVKIEQFHVRPQQIDPITGLARFPQKTTTTIFASPKQRLKSVPHSSRKMTKFLATTGACTRPRYATGMDASADRRRLGNVALRDHIYGAVVVEVENDEIFHMRNVRADTNGCFVDLGWRYDGDEVEEADLDALVLGDWHCGSTDPTVKEANFKLIEEYLPSNLVLHDFFDGHSVSWHVRKRPIEEKLIHQFDKGHHSLEGELRECYEDLTELSKSMDGGQIIVVPSNHHDFLNRWLNDGEFMKDTKNMRFGLELAMYMAEKDYNDPVEAGIKKFGKLPAGIKFLNRDEDFKVRGYQLSAHGDKGPGGGRGTMRSKENAWGRSISGHTHRAEILRDTYVVGTSQDRNVYYMRGHPSSWSHSHALLWNNGTVQMIHFIGDGKKKWRPKRMMD